VRALRGIGAAALVALACVVVATPVGAAPGDLIRQSATAGQEGELDGFGGAR
jgi:hypothetical protein